MGKEVNLFAKKKQPQPSQKELLAMVTGKPQPATAGQRRGTMPTPPPAKPMPGITGNPPLPMGKAVAVLNPSGMTAEEREKLSDLFGWTPDIPVPDNIADLVREAEAQRAAEEAYLPIEPGREPLKIETKDINKLSEEERAKWLGKMQEMLTARQQEEAARQEERALKAREASVPGLTQAVAAAKQAAARSMPVEGRPSDEEVFDDRGSPSAAGPAAPSAPTTAEAIKRHEAAADASPPPSTGQPQGQTGAAVQQSFCPHCNWNLSNPDIEEPSYGEKMSFLHALLGQKSWQHASELFGGEVQVTFRTLTTAEIDAVYRQAYLDRESGKCPDELDFWEAVNRYRMFLQLLSFRGKGASGFSHDLPDGLSLEANPAANQVWLKAEDKDNVGPGETALPFIESYLTENVLKNEAVFRVVNSACNRFNRLVSKMEVMADNSDFWKPTGAQS